MTDRSKLLDSRVKQLSAAAYAIPTDAPEADGTYHWNKTILVAVHVTAAGERGLGLSYADLATAQLVHELLAGVVVGRDCFDIPAAWVAMHQAVRNLGRPGICSMAIAAVDTALWDLKAKILGIPLLRLMGAVRDRVDVYGSGGFTSYTIKRLRDQLGGWVARGIPRVKMKIGTDPGNDLERVGAARDAIGPQAQLFVDANGAYSRKQALAQAERFAEVGVSWFEEPVSSDDLEGLHLLADRAPAGMDIAAGEYGYDLFYFRRMLEAQALDVLQADATRCAGFSGFIQVGALCSAWGLPLSAHFAPALHAHVGCAVPSVRHVEYFHDHARIEQMLLDGAPSPVDGCLRPDLSRPGLGMELKQSDAERYLIWKSG